MLTGDGKAHALEYFTMERPELGIRLSFEQDREKREGPFLDGDEVISTSYSEELNIATSGWVYHPALLEYSLTFSPEWDQTRANLANDTSRTSETFLSGYDAEFRFLQYKPYSLTLYGERKMSTRRNNFAERSTLQDDLISATFDLMYTSINSSLEVLQRESEQAGLFNLEEDERRTELNIRHNSKLSSTTLSSTYKDMSTKTSADVLDTNSFITTLQNRLLIKNSSLNSKFHYEETDRSFSRQRHFTFDESLDIIHRPNFRTSYFMLYDKFNILDKTLNQDNRSDRKSINFRLYHMLYKNLSTNIQANASEKKSRAGRETFYGTGINWGYSRYFPSGRLNLNAGYNYALVDQKVRDTSDNAILVQDESVTLSILSTTFLANQDVLGNTIRVTEDTSINGFGIIYREGIDYDVVFIDRSVQIIPKPVLEGETVFVEYRYIPSPAFDYSFFTQYYGASLNLWSALDIYYRLNRSNQKLIDGIKPENSEFIDDSIHTAGMEYNWKWSSTSFEWEDRYTTNTPMEKWRADEQLTFRPLRNTFLTFSAAYGEAIFKNADVTQKVFSSSSGVNVLLSGNSQLRVDGSWSKRRSETQNLTNSKVSSLYQWRYRVWELNIEYEFSRLRDKDEDDQEFTSHYVSVELIRELF
jgi:hypothetical protein